MKKSTAGVMTSFACRLWSGQLDRIRSAASIEGKSLPEWVLEHLMPATEIALGDKAPLFPDIKRRPTIPPPPSEKSNAIDRVASRLKIDPSVLREVVREVMAEQGESPSASGTRRAIGA